jgi:hypothetical protein
VLSVLVSEVAALAGPPLLSHPIAVNADQSLPWGKDAFTKSVLYDPSRLVNDTLKALDSATPVLVRMETLRRATLYINKSTQIADDLMGSLMSRVLNSEASGQPDATAWFDAGYLAACFSQSATSTSFGPTTTKGNRAGGTTPNTASCCPHSSSTWRSSTGSSPTSTDSFATSRAVGPWIGIGVAFTWAYR